MADKRLGNDFGEKLEGCLRERHHLPCSLCDVAVLGRHTRHVAEQCLQGCGQRPRDHHLENRGELGWRRTFLLAQDLGVISGGPGLLNNSPLALLQSPRSPFPILDPSWVLEAGGGRRRKCF